MEKRGQFTFYRSYYEAVGKLSERMRHRVLMSIIAYGLDGVEPEGLVPVEEAIFMLVKPTLDSGRRKAAAGMQGAVASGKIPALPQRQTVNKGEKEAEKEKEMEKEIKKETESSHEKEVKGESDQEKEAPEGVCGWEKSFEEFWDAYPVKVDRLQTRGMYRMVWQEHEAIMKGLKMWLSSLQWQREGGRFIPRPSKFLRERHFEMQAAQRVLYGATGELGQAEVEAIERMMREE